MLFAHRSQAATKQKGMQAADGLVPEIATVPEERRSWDFPPQPPMPQAWPHCSPHQGRKTAAPAHLQCSLATFGHPAKSPLAVNPPHSPFSLRNYFLIMTELNVLFSQLCKRFTICLTRRMKGGNNNLF